ncbi:MAG TPA: alpha/beta hydrolase, partial [Rhodanobacteraceae bacterium]|nr:alpha/beta hydrolase [Rhodanobacteraceae bacterium]
MISRVAQAIVLLACCGATAAAHTAERACHVDGIETPVTCVTIDVPRDYDRPEASTLALTAVIVPATTGRPAPDPLLVLAGGPGQSATSLAGPLGALLTNARRQRDVILFDVRGTGLSEPLPCEIPQARIAAESEASASSFAEMHAVVTRCLRELGERVLHHTAREVVEDIERFRAARGYEQLNLWGGSFGTRIAQHYVRAHGERVRAVVLDAVTPVGTSVLVTGARTPDVALARMLEGCRADAACAAAFPALSAELERLLAEANAGTIRRPAVDPVTGEAGVTAFDYFTLTNSLRVALYARATTELLPFAISSAAAGRFAPLLGIVGGVSSDASLSIGAQLSMLCAEDWALARDSGSAARTGGFMRDGYYEIFDEGCEIWPHEALPKSMQQPFTADVPALAISGELDPVTPPELAE